MFGSILYKSMCGMLDPQPLVLLGVGGTFQNWGLVEGGWITVGMHLKGILRPYSLPLSFPLCPPSAIKLNNPPLPGIHVLV